MTLPDGFLFSQSNLQDYVDCQRRFQLKHILHQAWPAVEAEPYIENERLIDRGMKFHRIVRQYLSGVTAEQVALSIRSDETMQRWWENFLASAKSGLLSTMNEPGIRHYEEISLSVPIAQFRLIAKYDLLVIYPDGRLQIFDWKTAENHPRRRWLTERLQTHVYPYVLAGAGVGLLPGRAIEPGQVEMIYWFTNQPEQPERFPYSPAAYREDNRYLPDLVSTISHKGEKIYPLTPDVRRCLFCTYRSLCNRGVSAGDMTHLEEWLEPETPAEVNIDFDQIGEIEF